MNEITEDIDTENPVCDHDSTFKDSYLYFGTKKYQSRSRHLNKKKDPYDLFWSTGQLKPDTSQVYILLLTSQCKLVLVAIANSFSNTVLLVFAVTSTNILSELFYLLHYLRLSVWLIIT